MKKIIIIGAGLNGLTLAEILLDKGFEVILIENGNENFKNFSPEGFFNSGLNHVGIKIGRCKGIGGTTNLWGGQLVKFVKTDFDKNSFYDQPNWPITWDEMKLLYSKASQFLGYNSDMDEFVSHLSPETDLELFYSHWLKQPNFKFFIWEKIKNHKNLIFHENSQVIDLNFKNKKCKEVVFVNDKETKNISDFDNVILSCGTIEIVKLMLACQKKEDIPFNNNMFIGKYFHDHICLKPAKIINASPAFFELFSNSIKKGIKIQPKIRFSNTITKSNKIEVSGYFSFNNDINQNLENLKQFFKAILGRSQQKNSFVSLVRMAYKTLITIPQTMPIIYKYVVENKIHIPYKSEILLNIQSQQISIKESSISLLKNKKVNGKELLNLKWQIDGREIDDIKVFCEELNEYLTTNKLGQLKYEEWFLNSIAKGDDTWISHVYDVYHQSGGTIMGTSPSNSVVDKNLKVHDTANLFICSPSVMPTSSYANTGFTSLALCFKLTEYL